MSFVTGTQVELLYNLNASITKNTYTTQAAFTGTTAANAVCSMPPGWLLYGNPTPVGRSLHLEVMGTIANTSAATFAVALGMDPTAGTINQSITVYAATAPTASTTTLWHCQVWYTCTAFTSTTSSWQVNGYWTQSVTASGAALGASGLRTDFQGTQTGINPQVINYIELFGTWSASSASNTTTVQQMLLWGLN